MIEINVTVLVQCVNFVVALYLLNTLLIRPVRTIIQQRRDKILELETSASDFTSLAEERLATYEAVLEKTRLEALSSRLDIRQEALGTATTIVHDAELVARTSLESAHARVKQEVKEAQTALQNDMRGFVDLVIKKIL